MGGDGGCVPQRADIVKTRGYDFLRQNAGGQGYLANTIVAVGEDRVGKQASKKMRMRFCGLTNEILQSPVVCDRLGNLFNKEAIITALLMKKLPESFGEHIRGLKDLVDCKGIEFGPSDASASSANPPKMICKLDNTELDNGTTRCVAIWKCGCVCTAKSLQNLVPQLKKSESFDGITFECPSCGAGDCDFRVPLAPETEELEQLVSKLPEKKKKKKKRKDEHQEEDGEPQAKKAKKSEKSAVFNELFKPKESFHARDTFGVPMNRR